MDLERNSGFGDAMFTRYGAWTNSGPIAASRHSAPNAWAVSNRGPDQARGFEMKTWTTSAPVSRGERDHGSEPAPEVGADPHAT